jgi:hypothetical protein
VAVDSSGGVYVADGAFRRQRVQKFNSAGQFQLMFGGGVVASGAKGTGTITDGSKTISAAVTTEGSFMEGQTITGKDIPAGTTVTAVGNTSVTLSRAASGGECASPCAGEAIEVAVGSGNVASSEKWTLKIPASVTGGEYKLRFVSPKPQSVAVEQTTGNIAYNAPASGAGSVEEALANLTNVGAGNVAVTEPSAGEYAIEFVGKYADTDLNNANAESVTPLAVTGSTLTGGSASLAQTQRGAAAGEVCTTASACQVAVNGSGPGQFGNWNTGAFVAVDSSDHVYVGDNGRVEKFSAGGVWEADLGGGVLAGSGFAEGLALGPGGDMYVLSDQGIGANSGKVRELNPTGTSVVRTISVAQPQALATDADGNLYVASGSSNTVVKQFDEDGNDTGIEIGAGDFTATRAIAAGLLGDGTATPGDVYVGNSANGNGYVRAYGPEPLFEPPPDVPPQIEAQYVSAVDTAGATVNAEIRPNHWTTRYYVQYGTAACIEGGGWEAGCVQSEPAPPGEEIAENNGASAVTVTLSGLEAHTAYRYRFVAESEAPTEGGPVYGKGGTPSAEGEAGGFATFAVPEVETGCVNDAVRIGASGLLPDCRAYELVSPTFKGGAEVAVPNAAGGEGPLQQAALSGGAITYGSAIAFGEDPKSAPAVSQYISRRAAGGWSTENPNPPFIEGFTRNPFVGFSADLSEAALRVIEPTLTPDAAAGYQDLYTRANASGALTALTTEDNQPESSASYCAGFGGASTGFDRVLFKAKGALLAGDPVGNGYNLYEWDREGTDAKQSLTVDATSGEYKLTITSRGLGAHSETTAPIAATATAAKVRTELEALPAIDAGDVSVSGGPGDAGGSSPYEVDFSGAYAGTYVPALGVTDVSLSGGAAEATVATVAPGGHVRLASILPSGVAATPNLATTFGQLLNTGDEFCNRYSQPVRHAFSADGSKAFWSYKSASETNENQIVAIIASSGKFTLSFEGEATGEIEYNASAGEVEDELNALSTINAEGGSVTVAGGPGSPTGTTPYLVSFDGGPLAGTDVEQLVAAKGTPPVIFTSVTTIPAVAYGGAYQSSPGVFAKNPLLARIDGTETVQIDASQGGSAKFSGVFPLGGEGRYWDASTDGSKVFFTDGLKLTADSTGSDLYLYDFDEPEGSRLADLTPGALTPGSEAAQVQGVVAASEEGDFAYFAAKGVLAAGATSGQNNLYAWHEGDGVRFIATLASGPTDVGNWNVNPKEQTARVAPDGLHLAFASTSAALANSVAGLDNTGPCGAFGASAQCREAYVYDYAGEALSCASCNPSGTNPRGNAALPVWTNPFQQPRYLTDGGGRLFFETGDSLALLDTNGQRDVYQWEAAGEGRCTEASPGYSARNEGCVDLISSGASDNASYLVDASPDGRDVFISTQRSLFPSDENGRYDVYDAREGGGFPAPVQEEVCETGEECHPGGTSAGSQSSAGSSAFAGPGNPQARRPCKPAARKAQKLSRRAKKLRRNARKVAGNGKRARARKLNRTARRYAKAARRQSNSAKRCRRANRRAGR